MKMQMRDFIMVVLDSDNLIKAKICDRMRQPTLRPECVIGQRQFGASTRMRPLSHC